MVLAEDEYRALLEVSRRVDWRFRVALVLAHETGHRIGPSASFGEAVREQDPDGIRPALHLRWTASLSHPYCNLCFTFCNS